MSTEIVPEEMQEMDYLQYKTDVLYQLGLTNKEDVKEYLENKCKDAPTELKKRIQIDNAARTIMMAYYDGDRTFCKAKKKPASHYHNIIKRAFPNVEAVYEDVITVYVGDEGLMAMREANLIEVCGMNDGRKLYAI